jgi:hypothetical protein
MSNARAAHDEETAPLSPSSASGSRGGGSTGTNKWWIYLFGCVALVVVLNGMDLFRPMHALFKPSQAPPDRQVGDTFFPIDWSNEDDPDTNEGEASDEDPIIDSSNDIEESTSTSSNQPAASDDDGFFPVDSGKEANKKYWPVVPDAHWNYMPRIFYPWNSTTPWCDSPSHYSKRFTPAGLILVKVHKAASSTLAGVNLRIAHHVGARQLRKTTTTTGNISTSSKQKKRAGVAVCPSREVHEDSRVYHNRDPKISFMYTSIRDPAQRAMSWVFYTMSNQGVKMTDEAVLRRLQARQHFVKGGINPKARFMNEAGAQVGYMHTGNHLQTPLWDGQANPNKVQNLVIAQRRVNEVLQQYDFIVIVERIQESLVVLQLLLGLKTTDILYLSSKLSGDYAYNFKPNPGCHKLTKAAISPAVDAYLSSPLWYTQNYQDYLLYKAANTSLELTIDNLGRKRFNEALAVYQQMMRDAKGCESEAIFPCNSDGLHILKNETNCYQSDWGCGYPCLDSRFGSR